MKIESFALQPYENSLKNEQRRSGVWINISDGQMNGWGEIAPLPKWSKESLEDSLEQINQKRQEILQIDWTNRNYIEQIKQLALLPSVSFGLESAILSVLSPLPAFTVPTSALLMGSPLEIIEQAKLRSNEGFTYAKLKVNNLSFENAAQLIHQLKDQFRLRIDVNRAWDTDNSLRFFSQFSLDTFDYVEEPFKNPNDLAQFKHPLAVDESFPDTLTFAQLESFPTLKALIYKPTIQGGMVNCLALQEWADERGISLVLSSSFESNLGLANIASMAHRLSLKAPIGIGTYHHLNEHLCRIPLQFSQGNVTIKT